MSFAELMIMGNVGKTPEVRYSPSGTQFCHFSVANNDTMKDKQGNKLKETTWFNVTCTGSLGDIAVKYLQKGDSVLVRGKLKVRKYNGNNGMDVSLDVFATTIHLMPNTKNENADAQDAHEGDEVVDTDEVEDPTDFNPQKYEKQAQQAQAVAKKSKAP